MAPPLLSAALATLATRGLFDTDVPWPYPYPGPFPPYPPPPFPDVLRTARVQATPTGAARSILSPKLPSYTPADGGVINCPKDDGSEYIDGDNVYIIVCYASYHNSDLFHPSVAESVPSVEGCARKCSQQNNCCVANFEPKDRDGKCYLKMTKGARSEDNNRIGLLKMNCDVLTTTITTGQSTTTPTNTAMSHATINLTKAIACISSETTTTISGRHTDTIVHEVPGSCTITTETKTLSCKATGYTSTETKDVLASGTVTVDVGKPACPTVTMTSYLSDCHAGTSTSTTSDSYGTKSVIIYEPTNCVDTVTVTINLPYNEYGYTSTFSPTSEPTIGGSTITVTVVNGNPERPPQTVTTTVSLPYTQSGYTSTFTDAHTKTVTVVDGIPSISPDAGKTQTVSTTTKIPYDSAPFTSTEIGSYIETIIVGTPSQIQTVATTVTTGIPSDSQAFTSTETPTTTTGQATLTETILVGSPRPVIVTTTSISTIPCDSTGYTSTISLCPTVTASTYTQTVIIGSPSPSSTSICSAITTPGCAATNCPQPKPTPPSTTKCPGSAESKPWLPCGVLNHKSNTFYLRSHVLYGSQRFSNLYVQDVPLGSPSNTVPFLSSNRGNAAQVYYDATSSSVAISQGSCNFAGFTMVKDRNMDAWSPVFVSDSVGSAVMTIEGGDLWWVNDRFGSWLACESGEYVTLSWWDVVANQGIDASRCAKIQLLTENL